MAGRPTGRPAHARRRGPRPMARRWDPKDGPRGPSPMGDRM